MKAFSQNTHSVEAMVKMISQMEVASAQFYASAVKIGDHAFIEFTGLMNEYIKMCRKTFEEGRDFTRCDVHSGESLSVQMYNVQYIATKLECIFGTSLRSNPEISAEFVRVVTGSVAQPNEDKRKSSTATPMPETGECAECGKYKLHVRSNSWGELFCTDCFPLTDGVPSKAIDFCRACRHSRGTHFLPARKCACADCCCAEFVSKETTDGAGQHKEVDTATSDHAQKKETPQIAATIRYISKRMEDRGADEYFECSDAATALDLIADYFDSERTPKHAIELAAALAKIKDDARSRAALPF